MALRTLTNTPFFALGVVLLLALGLSACVVIFALTDAILLRPLPVRAPGELYRFVSVRPPLPERGDFRMEEFEAWKTQLNRHIREMFAWSSARLAIRVGQVAEQAQVDFVSDNFYAALGVSPAVGTLSTQDVVLSHAYWQRRFAGDPTVIGRTLEIDGRAVVIAGVTARGFNGLTLETSPDLRLPLSWLRHASLPLESSAFTLEVAGRIDPDGNRESIRLQAESIWAETHKLLEPADPLLRATLAFQPASRGISRLRGQFGGVLWVLLVGVSLLLLIVCSNVAGLQLARGTGRRAELALRAALGATRMDLVRPLLAESLLLLGAAATSACGLTFFVLPLLVRALPPLRDFGTARLTMELDFTPDLRVAGFAIVVSTLTVLLCGLLPALASARTPNLQGELKSTVPGSHWLILAQVVLYTILLCGAWPLLLTLQRLRDLDPGFDADRILTFTLHTDMAKYDATQIRALQFRLKEGARVLPGIESVAIGTRGLMRGSGQKSTVLPAGASFRQQDFMNTSLNSVSAEYFATMGMTWLAGHGFRGNEDPGAKIAKPVVVNETFARRLGPHGSQPVGVLGARFGVGWRNGEPAGPEFEVIGVVSDTKYRSLREPFQPVLYGPLGADPSLVLHVRMRENADPNLIIDPIRRILTEIDPRLRFSEIATLSTETANSIWPERAAAFVAFLLAALSMLIAGAGLYAVVAYSAIQRRREIGIRMALGALPRDIVAIMLRRVVGLSVAGIAMGLACAWALAPRIAPVLFEVSPTAPWLLLTAAATAFFTTVASALLPAALAARLAPSDVLRAN